MINGEEILEDYRNEFKLILNDSLESETIAFLNSKGGNLYLGVDDKGNVVGLNGNLNQLQLEIKDRLKNNISPSTLGLFEIELCSEEEKKYLKISIAEGTEKPYYLAKKGMNPEGCFTRLASSIQKMSEKQINMVLAYRVAPDLKEVKAPRQDLKFTQLKIYYEAEGHDINDNFLDQLELFTLGGEYNYFAYLLSDRNDISVRYARYNGEDVSEMIEYNEFGYVSLVKATNDILEKIKIDNRVNVSWDEYGNRVETRLVDYNAVREAVVNAFVHTDWSKEDGPQFEWFTDRFVVTSYGGLPYGVSQDDFFLGTSHPRWRILIKIFTDLHLCEHMGTGIYKILKKYDKSIYEFNDRSVRVSFPFSGSEKIDMEERISPLQKTILKSMSNDPTVTRQKLSSDLGLNEKRVQRNIDYLKDSGFIKRIGSRKKGEWIVTKAYK